MGNSFGGKRHAKIMKVSGETFKVKTPIQAAEITQDYPGHVLLDSGAVKRLGTMAEPLDPHQSLFCKRIYFLVELPHQRRSRPEISGGAKERLEKLMLSRRTISDMSVSKPSGLCASKSFSGPLTVKMRLPKAEVERLISETDDKSMVAEKIFDLCMSSGGHQIQATSDTGTSSSKQQSRINDNWRDASDSRVHKQKNNIHLVSNGEVQMLAAAAF